MTTEANWIFCSVPRNVTYAAYANDDQNDYSKSKNKSRHHHQHHHSKGRKREDEKEEEEEEDIDEKTDEEEDDDDDDNDLKKEEIILAVNETWEEVLEDSLKYSAIKDVVWIRSKDDSRIQCYFPIASTDDSNHILDYLSSRGFGSSAGTSLGCMPFSMFITQPDDDDDEDETDEQNLDYDDDSVFEGQELKKIDSMSNKIFSKLSNKLSGFKKAQDNFLKSVTSRLTVAQVVSGVKNSSKVTFDFVMYTFLAGCIASCGIMNDAVTDIAAAMCIEPVMATVLVGAFGTVIHDWSLIKMGIRNNCIVITECILTGFLYGLIAMSWAESWKPPDHHWPTAEMVNRATYRSLIMGALQASAAGGAVALGLLTNNYTALVGVAIASTFLPHATNCGLLWAWTCHLSWRGMSEQSIKSIVRDPITNETFEIQIKPSFLAQSGYQSIFSYDMRWECMQLSYVSLLNTYVNVLCLYIGCTLILKLKEVAPLGSFEPHRKFFQEDMRIYRDYHNNRKLSRSRRSGISLSPHVDFINQQQQHNSNDDDDDTRLGDDILREWALIAGLDANKLLSADPKARITQIQTLKDLATEVQNDKDYRAVTSRTTGIPEPDLVRRLTHGQITIPKEFLERHEAAANVAAAAANNMHAYDNMSFMEDADVENSGINSVTNRRAAAAVGSRRSSMQPPTATGGGRVRIIGPSVSSMRTPSIVEEYGLRAGDLEEESGDGHSNTMPLRFSLRNRHNYSLWPTSASAAAATRLSQTDHHMMSSSPRASRPPSTSSPIRSTSRYSTSSRTFSRM